jgi:hypothetical protein
LGDKEQEFGQPGIKIRPVAVELIQWPLKVWKELIQSLVEYLLFKRI